MSRPKDIQSYPKFLFDMLDKLTAEPGQPVVFSEQSPGDIKSLRLLIFGFKAAAVKAGLDKPGNPLYYPIIRELTTRIVGNDLQVFLIDHAPDNVKWAKQLGK